MNSIYCSLEGRDLTKEMIWDRDSFSEPWSPVPILTDAVN